ncbi:hypothetical protein O181_044707 [Austropuccinia psidii MF-1]|uniref:Uncharacterized protein n=1 Tax=Austropuccinia psidii MF-1 TaxID=1389203 RepID=A0A9Q3DSC8_9BASI|nr:hypothetical protein [Austropuccinia psidii MF-1]
MVHKFKDWEMLAQIHQGVMSSWHILKKLLKEEERVRYSNGWNPLSFKPEIKKAKYWNKKKREVSKEEAPVASTSKPQVRQPPKEGKKHKNNNRRKPYYPSYRILIIQKDYMDRTLMEFKDK